MTPGCSELDCKSTSTCALPIDSTPQDAGIVDGGRVYPEVPPPPGCDPNLDIGNSPACVVDVYALFVDATNGNNANKGTRAAPYRSIDAATNIDALAGRPRIYVCGTAPYVENVRLPPNVSLYGGLDCGTWTYSGTTARITPGAPGHALRIDNSTKGVVIADLELVAQPGINNDESSVAVFVNASKATFRRVAMTAGKGANAVVAATPTNFSATPPNGEVSTTTTGAAAKTCACAITGSSTGGKGGNANSAGEDGSLAPFVAGLGGTGGGGGAACSEGGTGAGGAKGGSGGKRAGAVGAVTAEGWVPGRGGDGASGDPGAGGGGGGGNASKGGGGGACGGCGGGGGPGGKGGGGSIALALFASEVTLVSATLQTAQAGNGAAGANGEKGADGGFGGAGACNGGFGGPGAGGGGGAGGAGGVSATVARSGGSFVYDAATKLSPGGGGVPGGGGGSGPGVVIGGVGEDAPASLIGVPVFEGP